VKVPAALLREIIASLVDEEIRKVKGGYKVYPKKPQKGRKTRRALSKKPMSREKALRQLRAVERNKALKEDRLTYSNMTKHEEVLSMIDHAIGDSRINVDSSIRNDFKNLMKEIAIVETGYQDEDGNIYHDNEMNGGIKGIFQLSLIALKDLRRDEVVPKSKQNLFNSEGFSNPWRDQTDDEIFGNKKLQTIAACLYCLYRYYNQYGEGSLASIDSRAGFWEQQYNTESDEEGTAAYYKQKLSDFGV